MISPDIWTDNDVQSLSCTGAILLFIGAFSIADDHGRIEWNARQLRARIFAMRDDVALAEIESWMAEIVSSELVETYRDERYAYAHFPNWKRYQAPSKPSPSKLPAPISPDFPGEFHGTPDSPRFPSGQVRLGKDRLGEGLTPTPPREFAELEADVEIFIALTAAENKTGKIAESRIAAIRASLGAVLDECGDRAAFAAGLREANAKGKANANYVRACVRSAMERSGAVPIPKRRDPQYQDLSKTA